MGLGFQCRSGFGLERIMTFEVTPAALISDIHKGQFAKSMVRQSQHSAAALRAAALRPRYLLICFVSSMVSTSSTDLMVSRPFSFIDDHGSRFELPFLKYVNSPQTKWNACIGLPYGTAYWQVSDSSEQNGCFKMALTKYKRELLRRKELAGAEFAIDKQDITYIVRQAWASSFACIDNNKKAIAE